MQVVRANVPTVAMYVGEAVEVGVEHLSDVVRPTLRLEVTAVRWFESDAQRQQRQADLAITPHPDGKGATVLVQSLAPSTLTPDRPMLLDLYCDITFKLPSGGEHTEQNYHACRLAVFPPETFRVNLTGRRTESEIAPGVEVRRR